MAIQGDNKLVERCSLAIALQTSILLYIYNNSFEKRNIGPIQLPF